MLRVDKYITGSLRENCYIVYKNKKCIIIDPGDDADFLHENISKKNLRIDSILLTHGHFDHLMAAEELRINLNAKLYFSKKDLFLIKLAKKSASYFVNNRQFLLPTKYLDLPKKLKINDLNLNIIYTPGHTPGSACYYFKEEKVLFCGDLIFSNGLTGRCDYVYSNKLDLYKSIKNISLLPENIKVYPGHGDSFYLSEFKRSFNFDT